MELFIDTNPCASCDSSPCVCGREIEQCMCNEANKICDDKQRMIKNYKADFKKAFSYDNVKLVERSKS